MIRELSDDIRLSARRMKAQVLVTTAIVVTFGLATGLATTISSAAYVVLLRPFPMGEPERLITVWRTVPGVDFVPVPTPELLDLRSRAASLEGVAGFEPTGVGLQLTDRTVWADTFLVTANWFELLRIPPALGRTFTASDEATGPEHAIILTERFWRREFGGDTGVIGAWVHTTPPSSPRRIASVQVIGVVREALEFSYPGRLRPDIYMLRRFSDADRADIARGRPGLIAIARVRRDLPLETGCKEVESLMAAFGREHDAAIPAAGARTGTLHEELVGRTRPVFMLLVAAALTLLVLAIANILAVLLAMTSARRAEISTRLALGATARRAVQMVLIECLLLCALGTATGMVLAAWTIPAVRAIAPEWLPRAGETGVNRAIVCLAFGIPLIATLFLCTTMAVAASRQTMVSSEHTRPGAAGRTRRRFIHGLIVAQAAAVVALLAATSLITRGIWRLSQVDLGLDPKQVTIAQLSVPMDADIPFEAQIADRLGSLAGVEAVATASDLPFASGVLLPVEAEARTGRAVVATVHGPYFSLLRMSLHGGRVFTDRDTGDPGIAVVNEALVRLVGGGSAVGSRLKVAGRWREIVGVVRDVSEIGSLRSGIIRQPGFTRLTLPAAYLPQPIASRNSSVFLLVRTAVPPAKIDVAIRRELYHLNRGILIRRIGSLEERVAAPGMDARFAATVIGTFAVAALIIGAVGLYGLLTQLVRQRTKEVAIRLALGARTPHIVRSIAGAPLTLVATGLALGMSVSSQAAGLLRRWLFEISPYDRTALATAVCVLIAAAVIATLPTARRLSKVAPALTLRTE